MYKDIVRIDKLLRPYQQTAKEEIFAAWDECDNVMFQMPTGTGKTRLFTSIISDIKAWGILKQQEPKILIIAHRVELIEQISENLDKYKVNHGIIAGGKERNLRPLVQVASIQTITHRTNKDVACSLGVDFIIIDEAHHSTANSYKKLWDLYPNAKKLGVTATPWRMNHLGFISIYDKLLVSKSIKDFIKEGWLAPYCYYSIKDNSGIRQDIRGIDEFDIEGDYKVSALERVMDKVSIRANLLDSYLRLANGKKGIIYSISRIHSDHICEEYKRAGINIVRIDSETPREERRMYVQRFRNGQIDIIVNVDIFSEGFDCPDIEFIQLARPTKSLVKYLQQVGRGLRPTPGKGKCIILDNVGSHLEFDLPNADRDWETEFKGKSIPKKKHVQSTKYDGVELRERNYDEGSDELCLIDDVDGNVNKEALKPLWKEEDDVLLKTLFIERQRSLSVIAAVFDKDETAIRERLIELKLIQE
jgi:superfamily II DNA or RNA helicase